MVKRPWGWRQLAGAAELARTVPGEQPLRTDRDGLAGSMTRETHKTIRPTRSSSGPHAGRGISKLWANLAKGDDRTRKGAPLLGLRSYRFM